MYNAVRDVDNGRARAVGGLHAVCGRPHARTRLRHTKGELTFYTINKMVYNKKKGKKHKIFSSFLNINTQRPLVPN